MAWAMNMPALMTPKNAATTSNVATKAHLHRSNLKAAALNCGRYALRLRRRRLKCDQGQASRSLPAPSRADEAPKSLLGKKYNEARPPLLQQNAFLRSAPHKKKKPRAPLPRFFE